jgi:hypothetical protein
MGALAGDPRANAHYMELHKEDVARRLTSCVCATENSCALCAWIVISKLSCTITYALVTCVPCRASSSSSSLNRLTYKSKVMSTRFLKSPLYPLHSPLRFSPLARVILDVASKC